MTTAVKPAGGSAAALAPVRAVVRAAFGSDRDPGLAPGLVVADPVGWLPATSLVDGSRLPDLLSAVAREWRAAPHAAAALAWKSYAYWVALPPVLAWASARRVPLMHPDDVLVRLGARSPLLTVGLRPDVRVAVLPGDPLVNGCAGAGRSVSAGGGARTPVEAPGIVVVRDQEALLAALRTSLLDSHLVPLLEQVRRRVRLGSRTLLGSLASGVAHGLIHAADALPGRTAASIDMLLRALDVADLVDLLPAPGGKLTVQRKTCCLAFTLPEPKICADCCIRPT